jgi:hypothetical protein
VIKIIFQKKYIPWNRGLTKETDERIRKHADKLTGKHLSEEIKKKIGLANSRENNGMWKGNNVISGHGRAISWFKLKPCEICGNSNSEHHHKDSNSFNNSPENIQFLCRKHHMIIDKRAFKRNEKGRFK